VRATEAVAHDSGRLLREPPYEYARATVSLFRPSQDAGAQPVAEPVGSTSPGDAVSAAFQRFVSLPLHERASEVLAEVAPAIAAAWDAVDWTGIEVPSGTNMHRLLEPLVPQVRYRDLSPEQRRQLASLGFVLAEAFQALVLTRLLIRRDPSGNLYSEAAYVTSPDGLAALERGDVAAVVARRLPD
jgi:hypothetical protein